ncbi:hypothetical protein W97_04257 [Coniosporium apollinis CBS 100218]|uniref:RING-type domain-containing protein n=1 Tax=Coniosporium apollinis (strain CBS 100218) TaxID=1168221 RepID=R7YSX0_CONA1|nr:uncharacterized protein W97_04257 [Coniosporium apollinis CBS 100218]EON65022.1 hypothetical protein W97_04257 [Coniosporium apollinis CBS 100218]
MPPAQFPAGLASSTVGGASRRSPRHPRKATEKNTGRSSSKNSSKPKATRRVEDSPKEDASGDLLKAVQSDFDALRTLVTCKICDRLLYEPYIISCGHTYCYSCLCQWFVSNRTKKTCPDCRAVVKQAPAPAYLIREMTLVFINRAELLPLGETLEQHVQWQKEESEIVQHDKTNADSKTGGLFRGCFKHRPETPRAIRDEGDGVDRCPFCMYELEGGACIRCELQFGESGSLTFGESFGGFSDMDETSEHGLSSEDLDAELEMDDGDIDLGLEVYADGAYDAWHDEMADDEHSFAVRRWLQNGGTARPPAGFGTGPRRRAAHSAAGSRRRSYTASFISGIDEDSEVGTSEEEEEDGDIDTRPPSRPAQYRRRGPHDAAGSRRRPYPASLVSDMHEDSEIGTLEQEEEEEDDDDVEDSSMNDFINDEDSDVESHSNAPTPSGVQQSQGPQRQQRRPRRVVDSDTSSDGSDDDDERADEDEEPLPSGRRRYQILSQRGQRPNQRPSIAPSVSTDVASSEHDLDEEDAELLYQAGWSPLGHREQDGMEEDNDDSDGGSTTVGWEPTAISNERSRTAGSLTSRTGRRFVPIQPPSRAGDAHSLDGSGGLRRRRPALSNTPTVSYDDDEVDDNDSGMDVEDSSDLGGASSSSRSSAVRLRGNIVPTNHSTPSNTVESSLDDTSDADTDGANYTSAQSHQRRQSWWSRQQDYDRRISELLVRRQSENYRMRNHMPSLSDINSVARQIQESRNSFSLNTPLNVGARQLRQQLGEQSSLATLRQRVSQRALHQQSSQTNVRDGTAQPSNVHAQVPSIDIQSQPSHGRVQPLSSSRTLSAQARPSPLQRPAAIQASTSSTTIPPYLLPPFSREGRQRWVAEREEVAARSVFMPPFRE